jgi:prolyl-tRNA synthetase
MHASKFFIVTLREAPQDAVVASHILMLRAGLIRRLANGLHAYTPIGLRAFRKVEAIVREEMDRAGAVEIKPTVVVPAELWKESGRWETMGPSMLRARNRTNNDFVVSPTAEEAFTALVRDDLSSYKQLPLNLYQINTKFRDEIRPRYGVMRGREFTMMDAYSFDADQAGLDSSYEAMAVAYRRVFSRMSLSVIPVKADSGAMGGSGSEEFMVESDIGDDTLYLCDCGYQANAEKASCKPEAERGEKAKEAFAPVSTPDAKSIDELVAFLGTGADSFIKTLIYRAENVALDLSKAPGDKERKRAKDGAAYSEAFFAVLIRGDLGVNEVKLASALKASGVDLARDEDVVRITGAPVGFAGPVGLSSVPVIADESVTRMHDAYTGALAKDLHYAHVEPGRDFVPFAVADIRAVRANDPCPLCGKGLRERKGNELGHIFKLGTKYTASMKASFLDQTGVPVTPLMGCYGIGVDRVLASIIEEHHDDDGILWPMSVAPFHVSLVPVRYDGEVKAAADRLYEELQALGVQVLMDDRNERPGVKFKDADLLGMPIRVVVGEKNLPDNAELKLRAEKESRVVPLATLAKEIKGIVDAELSR